MRLLFVSLLVLLPIVAELANAQSCSGEPDAPEHATIQCFKRRGTCRAKCPPGYWFEWMEAKHALFICYGGEWIMKDGLYGKEEKCSPRCYPPCQNGECREPDTCVCEMGFTGEACDIPVCDPPCQNGECREPDTCVCEDGYTGNVCDEVIEEESYYYDYITEEPAYENNAYGGYDDNTDYSIEDESEEAEPEPEEAEEEPEPESENEPEPESEAEPEAAAEYEVDVKVHSAYNRTVDEGQNGLFSSLWGMFKNLITPKNGAGNSTYWGASTYNKDLKEEIKNLNFEMKTMMENYESYTQTQGKLYEEILEKLEAQRRQLQRVGC